MGRFTFMGRLTNVELTLLRPDEIGTTEGKPSETLAQQSLATTARGRRGGPARHPPADLRAGLAGGPAERR